MKKIILGATAPVLLLAACKGDGKVEEFTSDNIGNLADSISYYIGSDIGNAISNAKLQNFFNATAFKEGYDAQVNDNELLLDLMKSQPFIQNLITRQQVAINPTGPFLYNLGEFTGLKTAGDSISYLNGVSLAQNLKANQLEGYYSPEAFLGGLNHSVNKDSILIDAMIMRQRIRSIVQNTIFKEKIEKQTAFLNKISRQDGVQTLPSGLRYEVITMGTGPKPTINDIVETHYHGTLIDGTVFDSSVERGEPAKFGVGQVIPAWTEALQLMPVGSKWKLYCPSDLAYGDRGSGPKIGPYEPLVFEVELLGIAQNDNTQPQLPTKKGK